VWRIEDLLKADGGRVIHSPISPDEHALIAKASPLLAKTQVKPAVSRSSLTGVLDAVRNRVLETACEADGSLKDRYRRDLVEVVEVSKPRARGS
jgi:hypothetical protein